MNKTISEEDQDSKGDDELVKTVSDNDKEESIKSGDIDILDDWVRGELLAN